MAGWVKACMPDIFQLDMQCGSKPRREKKNLKEITSKLGFSKMLFLKKKESNIYSFCVNVFSRTSSANTPS